MIDIGVYNPTVKKKINGGVGFNYSEEKGKEANEALSEKFSTMLLVGNHKKNHIGNQQDSQWYET